MRRFAEQCPGVKMMSQTLQNKVPEWFTFTAVTDTGRLAACFIWSQAHNESTTKLCKDEVNEKSEKNVKPALPHESTTRSLSDTFTIIRHLIENIFLGENKGGPEGWGGGRLNCLCEGGEMKHSDCSQNVLMQRQYVPALSSRRLQQHLRF